MSSCKRASALAVFVVFASCVFSSSLLRADNTALSGSYVYMPARSTAIAPAINRTVADINFVLRPIVRKRLSATNLPYQHLVLALADGRFTVTMDKHTPIVTTLGGPTIKWRRDDGEVFDLSSRWQGSVLQQTFAAEDGTRVNRYELSADGRELTLKVTVSSTHLPKPLEYSLLYQRQ